jgi:predicted transcriptional regulator of viral defense system
LRNGWYCFKEFLTLTDFHYLIANSIYQPSYVSHQEALAYYGLIPEHIVDSVSVTTKKTQGFIIDGRAYKYYSLKSTFYFGYCLKEMIVNGLKRSFLIADKEKAILDLLYIYDFYKTEKDLEEIRFNEIILRNDVDWAKLHEYLEKFSIKTLEKKVISIKKIYNI